MISFFYQLSADNTTKWVEGEIIMNLHLDERVNRYGTSSYQYRTAHEIKTEASLIKEGANWLSIWSWSCNKMKSKELQFSLSYGTIRHKENRRIQIWVKCLDKVPVKFQLSSRKSSPYIRRFVPWGNKKNWHEICTLVAWLSQVGSNVQRNCILSIA